MEPIDRDRIIKDNPNIDPAKLREALDALVAIRKNRPAMTGGPGYRLAPPFSQAPLPEAAEDHGKVAYSRIRIKR